MKQSAKVTLAASIAVAVLVLVYNHSSLGMGERVSQPQDEVKVVEPIPTISKDHEEVAKINSRRAEIVKQKPSVGQMLEDRTLGDAKAPITLIEYSSFTCGHCAHFAKDIFPKLKADYVDTGKASFRFRDYPFDAYAGAASMLTRCVSPMRYYSFVDLLYAEQKNWASAKNPRAELMALAKRVGLDEAQSNACLENKELLEGLSTYREEGGKLYSIGGTPTLIIQKGEQTLKIEGTMSYATYRRAIDGLLEGNK